MVNPCYNTILLGKGGRFSPFPAMPWSRSETLSSSLAPIPCSVRSLWRRIVRRRCRGCCGWPQHRCSWWRSPPCPEPRGWPIEIGKRNQQRHYWLVVWNIWIIFYFIYGMSSFPTDCHIFQSGRYTTNQSCAEAIQSPALGHSGARLAGMVVHKGNIFNLGLILPRMPHISYAANW